MLILSRKLDERIVIDGGIIIQICGINPPYVKVGIIAPPETTIVREELIGRRRKSNERDRADKE